MGTWNNLQEGFTVNERLPDTLVDVAVWHVFEALCQILLMGHFRRRPVLAPGAAFFQLPFPFDAIGSGR